MEVKYTDYAVLTPTYFVRYLQAELAKRDLNGITGGRMSNIRVSEEHPLSSMVQAILKDGQPNIGILPAVSVVEGDEEETDTTIGHGIRENEIFTLEMLQDLKKRYPTMASRINDGLISDKQIQDVELMFTRSENPAPSLFRERHRFRERETVFISIWTATLEERKILSKILRSIIYDMRLDMVAHDLHDINIRTSKGLINFDFGVMMFGQETQVSFVNNFTNYTISDTEIPRDETEDTEFLIGGKYIANDGSMIPVDVTTQREVDDV